MYLDGQAAPRRDVLLSLSVHPSIHPSIPPSIHPSLPLLLRAAGGSHPSSFLGSLLVFSCLNIYISQELRPRGAAFAHPKPHTWHRGPGEGSQCPVCPMGTPSPCWQCEVPTPVAGLQTGGVDLDSRGNSPPDSGCFGKGLWQGLDSCPSKGDPRAPGDKGPPSSIPTEHPSPHHWGPPAPPVMVP